MSSLSEFHNAIEKQIHAANLQINQFMSDHFGRTLTQQTPQAGKILGFNIEVTKEAIKFSKIGMFNLLLIRGLNHVVCSVIEKALQSPSFRVTMISISTIDNPIEGEVVARYTISCCVSD